LKNLMLFLLFSATVSAQTKSIAVERKNSIAVFGGMGVHMVSAPDVVEYINSISTFAQRVDDFGVAVDFFGGVEFPIADEWGVKLEHSYLFKSYSFPGKLGGTFDIFYATQSPSVIIQKIITGRGFFVKLGAGGGYHFGTLTQEHSTLGTTNKYSANGIGVKAEAIGQTAFDDNTYGYIGGSLGWEFYDTKFMMPNSAQPVSLRLFHAGIRFGMNYYF
jgi:hypothetical protein